MQDHQMGGTQNNERCVIYGCWFVKRQRTSVNIKMCNATNIKTTGVVAWLFNGVIYKNLVSPYTKYQNK